LGRIGDLSARQLIAVCPDEKRREKRRAMHTRSLPYGVASVCLCPSFRLSRSCILSKRLNVFSNFFPLHHSTRCSPPKKNETREILNIISQSTLLITTKHKDIYKISGCPQTDSFVTMTRSSAIAEIPRDALRRLSL